MRASVSPRCPRFETRCSSIVFSAEEIARLHARGAFYQALMVGQRLPTTPAQQRFVDVCHGSTDPTTVDEHVWRKYCRRVAWEADPANRAAMGAKRMAAEPSWGGSRVAYREMKRQEMADSFRRQRDQ